MSLMRDSYSTTSCTPGNARALRRSVVPERSSRWLVLCAIFRSCAELRGGSGCPQLIVGRSTIFGWLEYSTNHSCRYARQLSNAMQQHIEYLLRIVSNAQFCAAGSMRPHHRIVTALIAACEMARLQDHVTPTGLTSAPPKLPERRPNACRPRPAWRVAGRKALVQRFVDDLVRRFLACFLLTTRSAALLAADAR